MSWSGEVRLFRTGETHVAAELIRSAIEGASESNDLELLGNALGMLANVELLAGGEPVAALQLVCDAQRYHRQIGDVAGRVADWLTAAAAWEDQDGASRYARQVSSRMTFVLVTPGQPC